MKDGWEDGWEDRVFKHKGNNVSVCLGSINGDTTWTMLQCENEAAASSLLQQLKQAVVDIYTIQAHGNSYYLRLIKGNAAGQKQGPKPGQKGKE